MRISQLNLLLSPSLFLSSLIPAHCLQCWPSIEYHQSATPKLYKSALTPSNLTTDNYKTLTAKRAAAEERYDEALKEIAWAAKLEALRQQELEKEWLWLEAEEKEQLQLEAKEKERQLDLKKKEQENIMERKCLDNLEKEKEKEDEENENLLAAAGIQSGKDGDSESDPVDPKTVAMAELRRRCKIAEGKKKAGSTET
ncbi:hypothetical protein EV421DRAFT_1907600 [Armillaria borealis]|uniref:Uncharacterized protein n=1 Tax=Armillaria borealis TaxID=47425 RepID=A0AA39MKC9_9AGAR|nr:hypothetical protein EV421DRAFT_1907600 [Armillaria borealis]